MKKLLVILFLSVSLSVIASSMAPNFSNQKYENHKIISEIQINNLVINHVAQVPLDKDGKSMCASPKQIFEWIELHGQINPDSTYMIQKLFEKILNSPTRCLNDDGQEERMFVFLNSGGGYLADGIDLGKLLRKNNAWVVITSGSECFSSCATAFLGGKYRIMESSAKIMFHAPYNFKKGSKQDIVCSSSNDNLRKYMQKMINEEDGKFLYNRTMSFCSSSDGWSLNDDAAKLLNITTDYPGSG
jgi:ATP-dependent protease ClpP protease subunit